MSIKSWKNRNYMLTRSDILSEAIHKCLVEMYKWAQPAINLDKLIADGYVEKVATNPVAYGITELGKSYTFDN